MTTVYGQIESLTRIKETLENEGIDRFSSIQDIKTFEKNFESEKDDVKEQVGLEYALELKQLKTTVTTLNGRYNDKLADKTNTLIFSIEKYRGKLEYIQSSRSSDSIEKVIEWLFTIYLRLVIWVLTQNFKSTIEYKTKKEFTALNVAKQNAETFEERKDQILRERSLPKLKKLTHTMQVLESLRQTIIGAIGENLVQKELMKLPGENILINDFSIEFETPIFYRKENDSIYSIQIDHLLVTRAGIFNIETKNWNENSIKRLDMRSPIAQVQRTGYALFVLLKGRAKNHLQLKKHHWGDLQIPIRNVVVMTNASPNARFQDAQVKTLDEINAYVLYFEQIYTDIEVKRIAEQLKRMKMDKVLTV